MCHDSSRGPPTFLLALHKGDSPLPFLPSAMHLIGLNTSGTKRGMQILSREKSAVPSLTMETVNGRKEAAMECATSDMLLCLAVDEKKSYLGFR